jgi:hypothetical protein
MQTFLPYHNFYDSLACLDYRRLGKQRVEAMQLVNSTLKLAQDPNAKVGWSNHPARTMWTGYLDALKLYHNLAIEEWVRRGYKNNMQLYVLPSQITLPHWVGNERLHASHRSNLLRKDPVHYGQFGWAEPDNIPYFWPEAIYNATNG